MVTTKILRKFQATSNHSVCNIAWIKSSEQMKSNFLSFLKNKKLSDCTLSAEGKRIRAHRVILAAASLYFQKLFMTQPNDKDPVIILHGLTYLNLCLLLKYAYTGEVLMAESRVQRFIEAAKSIEMIGLMEKDLGEDGKKLKKTIKDKKKERERPIAKRVYEDTDLSDTSIDSAPDSLKNIRNRLSKRVKLSEGTASSFVAPAQIEVRVGIPIRSSTPVFDPAERMRSFRKRSRSRSVSRSPRLRRQRSQSPSYSPPDKRHRTHSRYQRRLSPSMDRYQDQDSESSGSSDASFFPRA